MENEKTDRKIGADCCDEVEKLQKRDEAVAVHLIRIERRTLTVWANVLSHGIWNRKGEDPHLAWEKKKAAWLALVFNWFFAPVGSVSISLLAALALWFQFQELNAHQEEIDDAKKDQEHQRRAEKEWQLEDMEVIRTYLVNHQINVEVGISGSDSLPEAKIDEIAQASKRWLPALKYNSSTGNYEDFQTSPARGELLMEISKLPAYDVERIVARSSFRFADLTGTEEVNFHHFPAISNFQLDHSCFKKVHLKDIHWPAVGLKKAIWSQMVIEDSDFSSGDFSGVNMTGTSARRTDFSGGIFKGSILLGFRPDDLCSFEGADFRGALIERSLFDKINHDTLKARFDSSTIVVNSMINM